MVAAVTLVSDVSALEKLRPEHERLAIAALEPNPFFEHWLLLPAMQAYPDRPVCAVCVAFEGKLAAFFPFQRRAGYKGLPITNMRSWPHPHGLVCTPLVDRARAHECVSALFDWTEKTGFASMLQFGLFPVGGRFHRVLADVIESRNSVSMLHDEYPRGLLRRHSDADSYIDFAISPNTRKKLKCYEKRLREHGVVTRRVLNASDDVQRWIDEFLALEASGWKGANGSALACREENRRFARKVFSEAFARNRLIMVGIDLDGRPIARYTAFIAGDTAYTFKTAYDESYRQFAPGLLAELEMIRAFHALPGIAQMDSNTDRTNSSINRFWKHRLVVQRLSVATTAWGRFALLFLLPPAKRLKRLAASLAPVALGARAT